MHSHPSHVTQRAISLRELAFIRDVLVPRVWVQGAEVDELMRLRARIDGIFSAIREEQVATNEEQHPPAAAPERKKKPRHPKKGRRQAPPSGG